MTEEVEKDARLEKMEQIARRNRREELAANRPEPKAEAAPEPVAEAPAVVEAPVEAAPEVVEEAAPVVEAAPKPQFDLSIPITRKVNGVDVTKTAEEWIASGQKTEAADRYLAEASRAFKTSQGPAQAQAPAESTTVEDDNLAIARAIQTGTEDEAARVIARIRASQPAALKPEQLAPMVQEQVANFHAMQTFQAEFKDVIEDPNLFQVVVAENAKLLQAGYAGSNLDRLREAGNSVRKWRNSLQEQAASQKQHRKASVTVLPTASARAVGKPEEPIQTTQEILREMQANRRGR